VADICRRRNIPIENVRQHFNWSGKNCPQNIRAGRPYNWATFIEAVRVELNGSAPAPVTPTPQQPTGTAFKQGDIVQFTGGGVFISSTASTPAHSRGASRCKITQPVVMSRKNPYHQISEDKGNVHGWVMPIDVRAVGTAPAPAPAPVTPPTPTPTPATPALKPIDEIAREVIRGLWGNGQDRVNRLTAAGYNAATVQARVNQLLR
jgi:hypothetical protein